MLSHSTISMKTMTTFSGTSLIIKNTKGMTRRQNSPSAICLVQKSQILCIYTPTYIYMRAYIIQISNKSYWNHSAKIHQNTDLSGLDIAVFRLNTGICRLSVRTFPSSSWIRVYAYQIKQVFWCIKHSQYQ